MKPNQHVNWNDGHTKMSGRILETVTDKNNKVIGVKIEVGTKIIYRDVKRGKIVGE